MVPAPITAIVFTSMRCSLFCRGRPPQARRPRFRIDGTSRQESSIRIFVKTEHHLRASKHHWTTNEIRFLGHEFDGLSARWRMLFHVPRAIEFIPGIQELLVITFADQFVEFSLCQPLFIQIA